MRLPSLRCTLSTFVVIVSGAVLVFVCGAKAVDQPAASISIQTVRYGGLVEAVKAQRGKVLIVDIWAEYCEPCKEKFPHIVGLHRKHGPEGLVCFSVSLDDADQPERKEAALVFLKKSGATFSNFLLQEEEKFWQEKFDIGGPPAIFVFDRKGKRAGKFDTRDADKKIDELVEDLIREKP